MQIFRNPTVFRTSIVVTCFAVLSVLAREGEKPDDHGAGDFGLDGAVVKRLKSSFPGLRIAKVEEEKERGERLTEVRLQGDGKFDNVQVKLSESGEVLELEEDLDQNEVPEHVLRSLRKAFPEADIRHAEKETQMEITYQFDIEQNGTKHEVVISRRGRISRVASHD